MLWLTLALVLVAGALVWNTLETLALRRAIDAHAAGLRQWIAALATLEDRP